MSDIKYRLAWENLTQYMVKINEIMLSFGDVAADMPMASMGIDNKQWNGKIGPEAAYADPDDILVASTKQAAKLHYKKMYSMHAARTVALFAADSTMPAMGCMFVTGYDEIERMRAYAADGAHLASDNSVGEN